MSEQLNKSSDLGCLPLIMIIIAIAIMAQCSNQSRIADELDKIERKMK